MFSRLSISLAILLGLSLVGPARIWAAEEQTAEAFFKSLSWTHGPAQGALAQHASIQVPSGFVFAGGSDTRQLMAAFGNIVSDQEVGLLAPSRFLDPEDPTWFIVFEFNDVGFVKDDEKDDLDAEAMLKSIRKGTEQGNRERKQRGIAPMTIEGWHTPPQYDPLTHNLEWCIRAQSEGHQILNYNTRLLGRRGVMEVTLVLSPEELDSVLPTFRQLMSGFDYTTGNRYAEYQSGDKLAKYGLGALVVGAAAAGAAKLGLFGYLALMLKKLWKLVVVAAIAVVSFFKRIITGRSRPALEPETGGSSS